METKKLNSLTSLPDPEKRINPRVVKVLFGAREKSQPAHLFYSGSQEKTRDVSCIFRTKTKTRH